MKKLLFFFVSAILATALVSCSDDSEDYDAYDEWQSRNAAWYLQIADSARTAIHQAQEQYGSTWEQYCDWKMLKSLQRSQTFQSGVTEDSICVRVLSRGTGTVSPLFTDSVRVSFRGWLMPTTAADGSVEEITFTQTYYGTFDATTARPQLAAVSSFADGFSTVLQYMVEGDDWMVYIPQQLFYGEEEKDVIPAYSTVRFRIQLAAIYPQGTTIPDWK
ncbi:MAG: FKBP-type peptidyl-prolyl cis-trans isomerase [Bacteroidaceae bacterium]|nr:FKBP-type peptidyl-prolyl cis-trans isomerase [Bacteroidaceae bacterium]